MQRSMRDQSTRGRGRPRVFSSLPLTFRCRSGAWPVPAADFRGLRRGLGW